MIIGVVVLAVTIVTLDFQDNPPGLNGHSNFNYGGLRFSPPCGIHAGHFGASDQIYLQSDLDNSHCETVGFPEDRSLPNRDFLGTGLPNFYIDRHGEPFTLLGLAGVGHYGTDFTVVSSGGGRFHGVVPYSDLYSDLPWQAFELTGPEWTDIRWFTLHNASEGFGWQPHMGWDDIKYSVTIDEPDVAVLVGMAGLVLLGLTYKKYIRRNY